MAGPVIVKITKQGEKKQKRVISSSAPELTQQHCNTKLDQPNLCQWKLYITSLTGGMMAWGCAAVPKG